MLMDDTVMYEFIHNIMLILYECDKIRANYFCIK